MNGFKHGISLSDIGAACCPYSSLKLSRFISQDVSIEIGKNEDSELSPAFRINQFGSHDINIPIIAFDLRIFLGYLISNIQEFPIRGLDDIGLGDNGHSVDFIFVSVIKSQSDNPLSTLRCDDFKIHG